MTTPRHPAKFTGAVLDTITRALTEHSPTHGLRILDPFAGVGGVHQLHAKGGHDTVGVELQPEWAAANPRTVVGDATALPASWAGTFDALVTSPCYGNRMADHHQAADPCKPCAGTGEDHTHANDCHPDCDGRHHRGDGMAICPRGPVQCKACHGSGLSKRNTYAHALREGGAEPVEGSAAMMQWGPEYRELHTQAWREALRVLRPGGLIMVNISNHVRDNVEQKVAEWHLYVFIAMGCRLWEVRRIRTPRQRQGANASLRVDGELLLVLHAPGGRATWA